jgi:hypothetical protein
MLPSLPVLASARYLSHSFQAVMLIALVALIALSLSTYTVKYHSHLYQASLLALPKQVWIWGRSCDLIGFFASHMLFWSCSVPLRLLEFGLCFKLFTLTYTLSFSALIKLVVISVRFPSTRTHASLQTIFRPDSRHISPELTLTTNGRSTSLIEPHGRSLMTLLAHASALTRTHLEPGPIMPPAARQIPHSTDAQISPTFALLCEYAPRTSSSLRSRAPRATGLASHTPLARLRSSTRPCPLPPLLIDNVPFTLTVLLDNLRPLLRPHSPTECAAIFACALTLKWRLSDQHRHQIVSAERKSHSLVMFMSRGCFLCFIHTIRLQLSVTTRHPQTNERLLLLEVDGVRPRGRVLDQVEVVCR